MLEFDSWIWLDGSGFDYSNWGGAEAEYLYGNTAPLGVCFVMMSGGLWRAGDCEEEAEQFVCRFGIGMSLLLTTKTCKQNIKLRKNIERVSNFIFERKV